MSTIDPDDKSRSLTYVAELEKDESDTPRQGEADMMERIGKCLHPFLVPPKDKSSQSYHAFANPLEASIEQLEAADNSILRRFIHGLSTGNRFISSGGRSRQDHRPLFQKQFNSSFAVTATIWTTRGGTTLLIHTTLCILLPLSFFILSEIL